MKSWMLRSAGALAVALGLTLAIAAFPAAAQTAVPAGYPADYGKLIEAANKEGKVLIYGNLPAVAWAPFLKEFNRRYPAIQVQTLDIGDELYERYLAEASSNARTADIIVSSGISRWLDFSKRGQIADYVSPEAASLPSWAKPLPGLYALSADPMIIAYNKMLIPEAKKPKSVKDVAALVKEMGPRLNGKITTYDASKSALGYSMFWTWIQAHPNDGWSILDTVGPMARVETGIGVMVDKVLTGEYAVVFFASNSGVIRKLEEPAAQKITGYHLDTDGTPVVLRGGAITKAASSPNAARLFMDTVLSRDGQLKFAEANLTPYRADIKKGDVKYYTYTAMSEEVGEKALLVVPYEEKMAADYDTFLARWKQSFQPKK